MTKENFVVERIKELCEEKQMSRYALAQRSELQQSTISSLINKNAYPSILTLEKICNGFGITLAQFFTTGGKYSMIPARERELLLMWDDMDDMQKGQIIGYIKGIKENDKDSL